MNNIPIYNSSTIYQAGDLVRDANNNIFVYLLNKDSNPNTSYPLRDRDAWRPYIPNLSKQ